MCSINWTKSRGHILFCKILSKRSPWALKDEEPCLFYCKDTPNSLGGMRLFCQIHCALPCDRLNHRLACSLLGTQLGRRNVRSRNGSLAGKPPPRTNLQSQNRTIQGDVFLWKEDISLAEAFITQKAVGAPKNLQCSQALDLCLAPRIILDC